MSPLVVASLAGLLGLAAGSFANVVIQRAPRREPVG
jgi:prepilin signal peptidase PulO-like enzyme (type II secretory pathway)